MNGSSHCFLFIAVTLAWSTAGCSSGNVNQGCEDLCSPVNATRCLDGKIAACLADAEGCLAWNEPETCPSGACLDDRDCGDCSPNCPGQVASLVFSPPEGTYATAPSVAISTATAAAKIYYTTDGGIPSEASLAYAAPVSVPATATIKARAWKSGLSPSEIATATYIITSFDCDATITFDGGMIRVSGLDRSASMSCIDAALNDPNLLQSEGAKSWLLKKPLMVEEGAKLYINDADATLVKLLSPVGAYIENHGRFYVNRSEISAWASGAYDLNPGDSRSNIRIDGSTAEMFVTSARLIHLGGDANSGLEVRDYHVVDFREVDLTDNWIGESEWSTDAPDPQIYFSNVTNLTGFNTNKFSNIKTIFWDGVTADTKLKILGQFSFVGGTNLKILNFTAAQGYHSGWTGILCNNYEDCLWKNVFLDGRDITHNAIEAGIAATDPHVVEKNISFVNVTLTNFDDPEGQNGVYISRFDTGSQTGLFAQDLIIEDLTCRDTRSVRTCIAADHVQNMTIRNFKAINWAGSSMVLTTDDTTGAGSIAADIFIIDSSDDSDDGIKWWTVFNGNLINTPNTVTEFTGGDLTEWYYLDVIVADASGRPVPDVTVTVANQDGTIAARNLHVIARAETSGLLAPQDIPATLTGVDGHTPLPSDADRTLTIAGQRRSDEDSTSFCYRITAAKSGFTTATITDVCPDSSWLRADPNSYPGSGKGTVEIELR